MMQLLYAAFIVLASSLAFPQELWAQPVLPRAGQPPVIDVHMHVWSDDPSRFPFAHPYDATFVPPKIPASLDRVVKEMDEQGISHCVLVQTISHGWDNRY